MNNGWRGGERVAQARQTVVRGGGGIPIIFFARALIVGRAFFEFGEGSGEGFFH